MSDVTDVTDQNTTPTGGRRRRLAGAVLAVATPALVATSAASANAQEATAWEYDSARCAAGEQVIVDGTGNGGQMEFMYHHPSPRAEVHRVTQSLFSLYVESRTVRTGLQQADVGVRVIGQNEVGNGPFFQSMTARCGT